MPAAQFSSNKPPHFPWQGFFTLYQHWDSWSRARTQYSSLSLSVNSGKQSKRSAWNGGILRTKHLHRPATGTISFQFYNKVLVKQKQQKEAHLSLSTVQNDLFMLRPPTLCEEIIQSNIIELSHRLNPVLTLKLQDPNLELDLIYLEFCSISY